MANGTLSRPAALSRKKASPPRLKAFARFHEKYPAPRFTLAGEGPMKREIEQLARDLGIAQRR